MIGHRVVGQPVREASLGETPNVRDNALQGVEVAVTVDDLLLWDGVPLPPGYTHHSITESIIGDFGSAGLEGVYAFSCTAPLEDNPANRQVLDRWVDAGHHVGNHTHCHANLNFLSGDQYCDDIAIAETHLADLLDRAPQRLFRYAMDIAGPSEQRRGVVEDFLRESGYRNAPISAWFDDIPLCFPYYRSIRNKDAGALEQLRTSYVHSAMAELEGHTRLARAVFGRDIPYIWIVHATPLAQDLLGEVLTAMSDAGATFVPLESALDDPAHRALPAVSPLFVNHLERYALMHGVPLERAPFEEKLELLQLSPSDGLDSLALGEEMLRKQCDRANGEFSMDFMYATLQL